MYVCDMISMKILIIQLFSFLLPFGHELYEGLDGVLVEVLFSDHSLEKIAHYSLSLKFSFTCIP